MLVVGLIAFLSLREGFSGDQALFLTYSKAIGNGAILYKDIWDIKQPAIFVFYLVAGKLFGFTETGIHLLEIIYWLGFSLLLIFGLKKYFTNPLFAVLTPLFTVGIYYSVSGSLHLTQAEGLVCFPMFLCLWFCQKFLENPDKNKRLLFLSGFFGGIVLTFKLMFFLILLAFWFWLFVFCFYLFGKNAKRMLVSAALVFSGLIIPAAIVIIYFALNGALGDLYYTTFIYPLDAGRTITKMEDRSGVLINGLEWFLKSYFPVIFLTLLFPVINIKRFFKNWKYKNEFFARRENFLFSGLLIWAFAGFAVILIQKLSWWEYHYSLLMIPLGILAVKCLERLTEKINASPKIRRKFPAFIILSVMIAVLFVPTARRLVHKIRQSGNIETIKIGDREFGVTGDAAGDYKSIFADTAFLRTENPKPEIFIVSNPLYYYLSDSTPVFAANGAMSDMFTDFEWNRLDRELAEKKPKYIFIETRLIKPLTEANPSFINTVRRNYSVFSTGDRGSFYKLDE
ncbi:MAG: hypothetical protein ACR2F2_14065 [Pyrinomonadaceae bacterium]